MRRIAHTADRRVLTSAAVTVGAITVLAAVGLTIDTSRPAAPDITPLAEYSPEPPPATTPPPPTTDPTTSEQIPEPPVDPGAAHIEPATIPDGPLGIPGIALDAYHRATDRLGAEKPGCEMDWTVLAGIGQVLRIDMMPEPASWAMMIAGFGLVGAAVRRRRMATA